MNMRIYATNLAKYTSGHLVGKWLELPMDEDELKAEIKGILGKDEEIFITDYNLPFDVEEYTDILKINEHCQSIVDLDLSYPMVQALIGVLSDGDTLENALEKIAAGEYALIENASTEQELAVECYKQDMLMYLPFDMRGMGSEQKLREFLEYNESFIDWEQLGREMEISHGWTKVKVMVEGIAHYYYIQG